jgi:hypothetical protein
MCLSRTLWVWASFQKMQSGSHCTTQTERLLFPWTWCVNHCMDLLSTVSKAMASHSCCMNTSQGRLGVSVQIVPEQEATANPVGKGQESPNVNPYLPPPVGRLRLSANPLAMIKELVGPKMCLRITVLCCCVSCILFVSVFGATIMSTLTYIQAMETSHREQTGAWMLPPNVTLPVDFQLPP